MVTLKYRNIVSYYLSGILIALLALAILAPVSIVKADDGSSVTGSFSTGLFISDIEVSDITTSAATISWVTNAAADSTVEYGQTTDYDYSVYDADLVTEHSIRLTGLHSATIYHFQITSSVTVNDHIFTAISHDYSFTTHSIPPPPPPRPHPVYYYLRVNMLGETSKWSISYSGRLLATVYITSKDDKENIYIAKGTYCLDEKGDRLRELVIQVDENPPPPPEDACIIGSAYDFTPDGATFEPFIKAAVRYDLADIPKGVAEEGLVVEYYDEDTGKWLKCECTCDPETHCESAYICHFTCFAIIGYEIPAPPVLPPTFKCSSLNVSPAEVDIGQSVTISTIVTNTAGEAGSYTVTLKIDGVVTATKEVTVNAGLSKKVTFTTVKDVAGTYSVDIDGLTGSFRVKEKPVPRPPVAPVVPPPPGINWAILGPIIGVVVFLAIFLPIRQRRRRAT